MTDRERSNPSDDELLTLLAAALPVAPLEPTPEQQHDLDQLVLAHWATPRRRSRHRPPRTVRRVAIAGVVAALLAGTGSAFAAGLPLPAPVRQLAFSVGLPVTPPAVVRLRDAMTAMRRDLSTTPVADRRQTELDVESLEHATEAIKDPGEATEARQAKSLVSEACRSLGEQGPDARLPSACVQAAAEPAADLSPSLGSGPEASPGVQDAPPGSDSQVAGTPATPLPAQTDSGPALPGDNNGDAGASSPTSTTTVTTPPVTTTTDG